MTYYGRIFDQPPPNSPGPFVSKAEFHPRIEHLGRPFEKSFRKQVLTIQYPIKLAFIRCPENLGRGEVATIEVGIQNISSLPYGDATGSGGKVMLQVHFDQRLLPVGSSNIGLSDAPYTVTYDPSIRDSMYVQMHNIPPNETVTVQITVQMESRAELFDRCICQVDVYLRQKLIEYNLQKVRVSPFTLPLIHQLIFLWSLEAKYHEKSLSFGKEFLKHCVLLLIFGILTATMGFQSTMFLTQDIKSVGKAGMEAEWSSIHMLIFRISGVLILFVTSMGHHSVMVPRMTLILVWFLSFLPQLLALRLFSTTMMRETSL